MIIFIQAYHRKTITPRDVWITPDWYHDDWWQTCANTTCTPDIMREALNASLAVIPSGLFPLEDSTAPTFSGLVRIHTLMFNHWQTLDLLSLCL